MQRIKGKNHIFLSIHDVLLVSARKKLPEIGRRGDGKFDLIDIQIKM